MIPPAQRWPASTIPSARRREGKKTEAAGKRIHWLNTGDPIAFGFRTPAHMVAAVEKSLRDGENGYGPLPDFSRRVRPWPRKTHRAAGPSRHRIV
jgi:aspartate/methionine/tyrosine aminotransferase